MCNTKLYKDMKIVDKIVGELLIKSKTPIELSQAIANLSLQNTQGQYNEKIKVYSTMLEKYKSAREAITMAVHLPSQEEAAAIMHFNNDRRFIITE